MCLCAWSFERGTENLAWHIDAWAIWDTGTNCTTVSLGLLPEVSRNLYPNTPSEGCQLTLWGHNETIPIPVIIRKTEDMPNGLDNILLGEYQFMENLHFEWNGGDARNQLTLHSYKDPFAEGISFFTETTNQ